ncbi:MAG TPA: lamin tail domain-containing protein, partial [bacterium]|nr:lamin tail domain-containing protein [bacterium]
STVTRSTAKTTSTVKTTASSTSNQMTLTTNSLTNSKNTSSTAIKPTSTDSTPPDTTIQTTLPAITNTGTANFLLSSTEPGKFECQLNDQNWKTCPADYQLKNLVSGEYLLSVRAIDLAGNIDPTPATYTWLIDKKKPSISWLTKPSSTVAGWEVEFSVETSEEVALSCQLDNQPIQSCQTSFSYEQLTVGQHQIVVQAVDLAGNYSAKLTHKWRMLGGAPDGLSIDYPPANPWWVSSTPITISGQAGQASRVLIGSQVAKLSANHTWQASIKLVPGLNNLVIWPENEAGQAGASSTIAIILDNIKPSSAVSVLPETITELGFIVEWQGTDSGDLASGQLVYDVQYRLDNHSWQPWLSAVDYTSAVFDQPAEINQKIAFRCRARDRVGNWENWPASSAADAQTKLVAVPSGPPPKVVISQLATRGPAGAGDEFVELYNPNDQAVDLSAWRLQSKSASGATWINRTGDGLPTGSSIAAHGYFLLASADYSGEIMPDYRHGGGWGLSDDGGHLRLIDSHEYLLDKLGYNQANDPEGQPASGDLAQEHSLQRKARAESTAASLAPGGAEAGLGNGWDSDNNQADFVDQSVVQPRSSSQQVIDSSAISTGLAHLWHFSECLGTTLYDYVGSADINNQPFGWRVGPFDCAGYQTWEQPAVNLDLTVPLDPSQVTLAYWWRNASYPNEGRGHEYLQAADGQIILGLTPSASGVLQFWHYGANYRLENIIPTDDNWHLLAATQNQNQLKFYVDGRLKFQDAAEYNPPQPIVKLDLADENYPIDRDEIAIWQRALSLAEIRQLYQSNQPLNPYPVRPIQSEPVAAYYWSFDEGVSNIAYDSLAQVQLAPVARWIYSPFNLGVRLEHPGDLQGDLPQPLENRDVSLSFWWRSSAYPNESRANIILASQSGQPLFGLGIGTYGPKIHFNGASWYPLNLPINDGDWHQAVLVYDSYAYRLSFYLDGRRRWHSEQTWLISPLTKLLAAQDNWPLDIDELTIWQGALNANQIETIYELAKPELDK